MNRLIFLAAAGLTLGSVPALAQSKADDPTPPPAPSNGVNVTVAGQTFNVDPNCPNPLVVIDRRQVLNNDTIDTVQPFFRTTAGVIPGLTYQTLDVGLENVAVGQAAPCGKS